MKNWCNVKLRKAGVMLSYWKLWICYVMGS